MSALVGPCPACGDPLESDHKVLRWNAVVCPRLLGRNWRVVTKDGKAQLYVFSPACSAFDHGRARGRENPFIRAKEES